MSTTTIPASPPASIREKLGVRRFAAAILSIAVAACLLAGWMPLGVSIVSVFLFAGPHNWIEARYFLSRMPAKWGPLRLYFLTGLGGTLLLTTAFAALPVVARALALSSEGWLIATGAWNTVFVVWIAALTLLRARQRPRRDWPWVVPVAAAVIALNWVSPLAWDLSLVYLHPMMALWILDREIGRLRPEWTSAYRRCLWVVPALLGLLWWHLWDSPPLPGEDGLTQRITAHAGAGILTAISPHLLVSTHVFLETLHYAAWLAAIPCIAFPGRWSLRSIPLARRSIAWRRCVAGVLVGGATAAVVLWAGFLADYPLTRDVYFTVAMLHVLAEVPFLLRLM